MPTFSLRSTSTGNAVAGGPQRAEVVRHHEHGQPQALLQFAHQHVEFRSRDRVQTRGRLVEKQQLGIQCQGARKAGALAHTARQFGRVFAGRVGRQANHAQPHRGDFVHQALRQVGVFAQRRLHVLRNGLVAEQGAILEQYAAAHLHVHQSVAGKRVEVVAEHFDPAARRVLQPDDRTQQHGFAGPGTADHRQYLAADHIEIDVVMQDVPADARDQALDADGDVRVGHGAHRPSLEKTTENTASAVMTRKIDSTTACVVCRPTLEALRSAWNP